MPKFKVGDYVRVHPDDTGWSKGYRNHRMIVMKEAPENGQCAVRVDPPVPGCVTFWIQSFEKQLQLFPQHDAFNQRVADYCRSILDMPS